MTLVSDHIEHPIVKLTNNNDKYEADIRQPVDHTPQG